DDEQGHLVRRPHRCAPKGSTTEAQTPQRELSLRAKRSNPLPMGLTRGGLLRRSAPRNDNPFSPLRPVVKQSIHPDRPAHRVADRGMQYETGDLDEPARRAI